MSEGTVGATETWSPSEPPGPRRRLLQAVLGVVVGLGCVEVGVRGLDGGAFPQLNVYAPDAARGVRLRPGTETRVGRRGERVTHARINAQGYRGADWPEASGKEVLVVGDSLSFGLGVEEDEALPSRLRVALAESGRGDAVVLDASVPTYGPPEYLATAREVLATRPVAAMVVVLNLLNDVSELDRPNRERLTAVEGYAASVGARGLTPEGPPSLTERLLRSSHAAFHLWAAMQPPPSSTSQKTTEESVAELIAIAVERESLLAAARPEPLDDQSRGLDGVGLGNAFGYATPRGERHVFELVKKYAKAIAATGAGLWSRNWDGHLNDYGEERPEHGRFFGCGWSYSDELDRQRQQNIRAAHRGMIKALRSYAARPEIPVDARDELARAFAAMDAPEPKGEAAPRALPALPPPLAIEPFFKEALAVASTRGAPLLVVVAPLDLQVSHAAWLRHPITDAELRALDALVGEMAATATRLGAIGVDPTSALRDAGDAATLPDGHLSPAGHEIVARAISKPLLGAMLASRPSSIDGG